MTDNWTPNNRGFQPKRKPQMKNMKKIPVKSSRFKPSPCISCGVSNDAATGATDLNATPVPGDIMICLSCGHIAAYGEDMRIRELTEREQIEIAGDRDILHAQRIRHRFSTR